MKELSDSGEEKPRATPQQWFWEKITLTPEDLEMLWKKRGLLASTCAMAGFRSSQKSNEQILCDMRASDDDLALDKMPVGKYSLDELVDAMLWVRQDRLPEEDEIENPEALKTEKLKTDAEEGPAGSDDRSLPDETPEELLTAPVKPKIGIVPNKFLFGFGLKGKKPKVERKKGESPNVWGMIHPVLIPYLDAGGNVTGIRPHKGGARGSIPQIYIVRPCAAQRSAFHASFPGTLKLSHAVITEGEFKAWAVWQGMQGIVSAAALPGVTMAKPLASQIEDWIEAALPSGGQVIIAYDNEEKGDDNLPGYVSDPLKRYDAEIWAWYLCKNLSDQSFAARVATLPDDWRENGKADWDGALARMVKEFGQYHEQGKAWSQSKARIKRAFTAVLNAAVEYSKMMERDYFDPEKKRIIHNRLHWMTYRRKLQVGGDREVIAAGRLQKFYRSRKQDCPNGKAGLLIAIAKLYFETSGKKADGGAGRSHGCYYSLRPLKEESAAGWQRMLEKAKEESDLEARRVAETVLEGIPKIAANFHMECQYVLKTMIAGKESRTRMIMMHSERGTSIGPIEMLAETMATATEFRRWTSHVCTGYTWCAGQNEIDAADMDLGEQAHRMELTMVYQRGNNPEAKCWFHWDAAYPWNPRPGQPREILPDQLGVFWVNGVGYKLAQRDAEGQQFAQGKPLMHPRRLDPPGGVGPLWCDFIGRLYETVSGYDGWSLAAVQMARAVATDLIGAFGGFPIPWINGAAGGGKTTMAQILMSMVGSDIEPGGAEKSGISVAQDSHSSASTKAGLQIAFAQYGDLPIYCEEVQPYMEGWLVEILKGAYGRERAMKKTYGENDRRVTATALVTGIATTGNPQLKSRALFVSVSKEKRKGNHLPWFKENAKTFYVFFRLVMRNLPEFRATVFEGVRKWMDDPIFAGFEPRNRLVYGIAYASMAAMFKLLKIDRSEQLDDYRLCLTKQMQTAAQDLKEDTDLHKFWQLLLNAFSDEAFGRTPRDLARYFLVESEEADSPASAPEQVIEGRTWERVNLSFHAPGVIDVLKEYARQRGETFQWGRSDLLSQLKTQSYWLPPKKNGCWVPYSPHLGTTIPMWKTQLDYMELGCRPCTIAEVIATVEAEHKKRGGLGLCTAEDFRKYDPRRGELYRLIDAVRAHG